jgi:Na+/H+-dicarboxylate symporter/ABC-type amino acid transport substrate-binding protein
MSLSTNILLGLVLGIAAGLFFGEPMGALDVAGDAFVRLLQMTVLPYVVVSLIAGLGRLSYAEARSLAVRGGALLFLLWAVAFAMVAMMPLAFPPLESASFFSTTLVERAPSPDFVEMYIPSNPFHSMANNLVPAVVLFSIALGVALIGMEAKDLLVESLDTLGHALLRVTGFVVRLTPLGVFAIGASAAGTMTIDEFARVQVYLVTYIGFSLIMSFWLLPGLLTALTAMRQRDVVFLTRDAMITAFATGSTFVVIPLLAERSKELLRRYALVRPDSDALIDVLIPVSQTFPHAAKVLTLSFVVFAGWFADSAVPIRQYPTLAVSGVASTFGSVNVAVPFLLDLMHLPHDLFQLFVATSVVNARFGTLLAAMHVLVLTLLGTCALTGVLTLRWGRMLRYLLGTLVVVSGFIVGARIFFAHAVDTTYRKDEMIKQMHLVRDAVPAVVHRTPPPTPERDLGRSRLDTIRERGALRVGYQPEGKLPFVFFNAAGELVGLDVEMAHSLARGLRVTPEFVPLEAGFGQRGFAEALDAGYCDIVMSGSALTMTHAGHVEYSQPYLDLTIGFIVRDHRRSDFAQRDVVEARRGLRIAVPDDRYYRSRISGFLPRAELAPIRDVRTFLEDEDSQFDAMLFAAEIGSAWSLLYPDFAVVVPSPPFQDVPLAYPVPRGELDWLNTVDTWIELKRSDGTIKELYDYWILGRAAAHVGPRWSVIRDVLHWVD